MLGHEFRLNNSQSYTIRQVRVVYKREVVEAKWQRKREVDLS